MALLESMALTLISWSKALLFSCPPISVIFKYMLKVIYISAVLIVFRKQNPTRKEKRSIILKEKKRRRRKHQTLSQMRSLKG